MPWPARPTTVASQRPPVPAALSAASARRPPGPAPGPRALAGALPCPQAGVVVDHLDIAEPAAAIARAAVGGDDGSCPRRLSEQAASPARQARSRACNSGNPAFSRLAARPATAGSAAVPSAVAVASGSRWRRADGEDRAEGPEGTRVQADQVIACDAARSLAAGARDLPVGERDDDSGQLLPSAAVAMADWTGIGTCDHAADGRPWRPWKPSGGSSARS